MHKLLSCSFMCFLKQIRNIFFIFIKLNKHLWKSGWTGLSCGSMALGQVPTAYSFSDLINWQKLKKHFRVLKWMEQKKTISRWCFVPIWLSRGKTFNIGALGIIKLHPLFCITHRKWATLHARLRMHFVKIQVFICTSVYFCNETA